MFNVEELQKENQGMQDTINRLRLRCDWLCEVIENREDKRQSLIEELKSLKEEIK